MNAGLIARWTCDLTSDAILESEDTGLGLCSCSAQSYEAALDSFVRRYIPEGPQRQAILPLQRASLLQSFDEDRTHFSCEVCLQPQDQLPMWISASVNLSRSPESGHVECITYVRDITDKTLEEQVFSRLPLLGFDVVGLLYVSTHACRYFRIKKMRPGALYEHLEDYYRSIGEDIEKIVLPEQRGTVREGLRIETIEKALRTSDVYPFTYSMISRSGEILQKLLQFSYLDETHSVLFFCKSDITKQTESEHRQIDALQAAKLEAEHANEAKSMFLSSVSHDLRTPLNGIIGFTDLALKADTEEKRLDYLRKIRSSADLLLSLVNDTLDLSRIESGKYTLSPEPADCSALLNTVVLALQPMAEKKDISLKTSIASLSGEPVLADSLKLQKIYLNLLSNAIKYTPAGGFVKVDLQYLPAEEDSSGVPCDLLLQFKVRDSGIGIGHDFLPRLFEPFTQEHRKEASGISGTGLGLSIVKKTVDLMHGKILVDSEPGVGSCFTVVLPLKKAAGQNMSPAPAATAGVSLRGRRVLLCEDNYLNAEIASTLLGEEGIAVDSAENGKAGLDRFRSSSPGSYDAILMDVRMPVMDGYEATQAIRALDRSDARTVPVIAMTADTFADDLRRQREAGMDAYIAKPVSSEELRRVLQKAMGAGLSANR
ncbi:MAG: ATP-binding protein [Lachnospiraceae bacterium]|nr:ATP-binding protein [Lachnospiraceae bacterium]